MVDAEQLVRLLQATAGGDQKAFAELYTASSSHLFGLLLRILKRRDWAEEALQDCYVKIWQKADTYAPDKGAPLTWMMTVARYRALDLLRVKRPEVEMPEDEDGVEIGFADESSGIDPEARAVEGEGLGRLEGCLEGLQEEQRRSVLLAYYEGYTHQELASVLDAPLGTVKSWVRRGLQRLRECLGE
ncbi:sigma-70 family RNA polymerase sigma factor [Sinimarinibacterium sp. CAU 1509]|uniref:sigma-70 family RNA polymerase sigma factor n=1 Tax=Sinimarinibacterium sp. CAU 1509 TaxID=2562283 RepID=UPI0010AD875B|nr:sigma-70 family RNA polymerase sigma factor [Sinimarinibacterium sp. CAU 1509]TJY58278.1 sigma-70 family RNA polymerase sigma factor [Sinimarinibacterium sp. CAU 1509]